jgi:hypothetical protein
MTEMLKESTRGYEMQDVILDYSHIPEHDRRYDFVHNKVSDDYKIAKERFMAEDIEILVSNQYSLTAIMQDRNRNKKSQPQQAAGIF